jgi:hypothetical protein
LIIQYVKPEQPAGLTSNGSLPSAKELNAAPTPPAKPPAATVKEAKPER